MGDTWVRPAPSLSRRFQGVFLGVRRFPGAMRRADLLRPFEAVGGGVRRGVSFLALLAEHHMVRARPGRIDWTGPTGYVSRRDLAPGMTVVPDSDRGRKSNHGIHGSHGNDTAHRTPRGPSPTWVDRLGWANGRRRSPRSCSRQDDPATQSLASPVRQLPADSLTRIAGSPVTRPMESGSAGWDASGQIAAARVSPTPSISSAGQPWRTGRTARGR